MTSMPDARRLRDLGGAAGPGVRRDDQAMAALARALDGGIGTARGPPPSGPARTGRPRAPSQRRASARIVSPHSPSASKSPEDEDALSSRDGLLDACDDDLRVRAGASDRGARAPADRSGLPRSGGSTGPRRDSTRSRPRGEARGGAPPRSRRRRPDEAPGRSSDSAASALTSAASLGRRLHPRLTRCLAGPTCWPLRRSSRRYQSTNRGVATKIEE